MMLGNKDNNYSGRVNAVFVFDIGGEEKAVVTSINAISVPKGRSDLRFSGPVCFSLKTARHIEEVVMPTVRTILASLKIPEMTFEISVVNLDVAAAHDVGLEISGFSADVPFFLALLSAGLKIPVDDKAVFTGHIASKSGAIRMVRGMPAKIKAVTNFGSFNRFFHPFLNSDYSFDRLLPKQKEHIKGLLYEAKRSIRTISVGDIGALVNQVFTDEQIVQASLHSGFFKNDLSIPDQMNAVGIATRFFSENNEQRFWALLERQFVEGHSVNACKLLQSFADFHIKNREYPKVFGRTLIQLLQSLPPMVRRRKLSFPLIPVPACLNVGRLADRHQYEDVLLMFKAVSGDKIYRLSKSHAEKQQNTENAKDHRNAILEAVLLDINADTLTASIGMKIDSARANFLMDTVIVNSHEEFSELISSFYLHLLRYTRKVIDPVEMDIVSTDGFALLERSFSRKGGFQAALAEAKTGNNGGIRFVLDIITDQFKQEQQRKHVEHVLKSAIDPLDWQGKVNYIKALLDRLKFHLPNKITSQPAERYASHYEGIVEAYVQSMDQLKSIIRSY